MLRPQRSRMWGLDATPKEPRRRKRTGSIGEEREMTKARAWSWIALASAALALALAAPTADAQDKTLKIGVLTDMTSVSADIMGAGSVLAAQMAVEDAGGSVAGMKVE